MDAADSDNVNKGKRYMILTLRLVSMALLAALLVLLGFHLPRLKFILFMLPFMYVALVIAVFAFIESICNSNKK
jgi:hypothetical protein